MCRFAQMIAAVMMLVGAGWLVLGDVTSEWRSNSSQIHMVVCRQIV